MNFASLTFAGFYSVVFCAYWLIPHRATRKCLLLAASYYFYMSWNVKLIALILTSTVMDYLMGLALSNPRWADRRRLFIAISCAGNLGFLAIFKYANFFLDSFRALAGELGIKTSFAELRIILPVGISFYTFQTLSYTLDVYRNKMKPCRNFLDFALFVAFFPQLVSGPIVRALKFLTQLEIDHKWNWANFTSGLWLTVLGLAKKIVVADTLSFVADPVFSHPGDYGFTATWLGVIAFAFQIYCDFSGYSDVAIGTARMLGFELPKNFDHPYLSQSVREFWQRWHISLSTWLRDYLYIPLGGNRDGSWRTHRNLMITMILGGFWHGASWTFIAWGFYQGIMLVITRLADEKFPRLTGKTQTSDLLAWVRILFTFAITCFGWVLFRARTLSDALALAGNMIGLGIGFSPVHVLLKTPVGVSALWIMGAVVLTHTLGWLAERHSLDYKKNLLTQSAMITACILGILTFAQDQQQSFIYFQF